MGTAERAADEATGKRDAATRRVRESAGALAAAKVEPRPRRPRSETSARNGYEVPARFRRIPWKTIGLALAGAAVVAWMIGFVVGLIVRLPEQRGTKECPNCGSVSSSRDRQD